MDQLLRQEKSETWRVWVTFCSRQQPELDEKIVAWSKQLGLARLPISVFEDDRGPPAYRLPREEGFVVVVFAAERKIVASRVYAAKEFRSEVIKPLTQEVRQFLESRRAAKPGSK
ncbi:MAG: hypothetical protein RMJ19_05795 [Gemmatales bacterium]|nr:hypothetical protein [Gemmatales bacterium]MCS7159965.1 hypothetical protein [Gemmatales bacterium]MDW8175164.1 hypothetical protein [Gemmatales bacterium]MDW8222053.1 hypothetical protein [Gemmatales bacterium]